MYLLLVKPKTRLVTLLQHKKTTIQRVDPYPKIKSAAVPATLMFRLPRAHRCSGYNTKIITYVKNEYNGNPSVEK